MKITSGYDKPQWGELGKSPEDAAKEVGEITDKLADAIAAMQSHEEKFVQSMYDRHAQYGDKMFVSPKQLFWLRDLLEKYL